VARDALLWQNEENVHLLAIVVDLGDIGVLLVR
jgi:hypothetical protein